MGPQGISIDPKGNLYIADTGNHRVQKFDPQGNFLAEVGGFGWAQEQFQQPIEVCAKSGLDVFVVDYQNQRIERYDKDLHYLSSFYSNPDFEERLQFGFPSGVDLSIHGELFIVDQEHYRVLKVNSFGEPQLSFGDFDWGTGRLEKPSRVEVTRDNHVYVSDESGDRVVAFDYYGNFLIEMGRGELKNPRGLAADSRGRLFVADTGHHRITVFDRDGQMLIAWGSEGEKIGAFNSPADVAVFQDKIFVLDSGNGRVQVFQLRWE